MFQSPRTYITLLSLLSTQRIQLGRDTNILIMYAGFILKLVSLPFMFPTNSAARASINRLPNGAGNHRSYFKLTTLTCMLVSLPV